MPITSQLVLTCSAGILLCSCGPQAAPTYFIPPTLVPAPPASVPGTPGEGATPTPEPLTVPTLALPSPTPPCTDDLDYLQDLTIPDGSTVAPGQPIDKRWQVSNSGTCNWDERYQLRLVNGDSMGAGISLPLYPARGGAEATLRIRFTAPPAAGTYECQWQAVNPDGVFFGDAFYMQVVVSP